MVYFYILQQEIPKSHVKSRRKSDRSAMRHQAYTKKLHVRRLRVKARMGIKFPYHFSRRETSFRMVPVLPGNSRTLY